MEENIMGGFPFFRRGFDGCGCGGLGEFGGFGGFFGGCGGFDGRGCGCGREREVKCITAVRSCCFKGGRDCDCDFF